MRPTFRLILLPALMLATVSLMTPDNTFPKKENRGFGIALSSRHLQENSPPDVRIVMPEENKLFTWGTQVRYAINVSDGKDGESRYGEIDASKVLLEIEYLPASKKETATEQIKKAQTRPEHKGLTLLKKSTCFGCHADKTRVAGPSFLEIAGKYGESASVAKNLARHIVKGSSGIWGDLEMPAHPDLTEEEGTQIASYILGQGANKFRWVYPGLEGAFRIIDRQENDSEGTYILTASYTAQSNMRGVHTVVLKIK